MGDDLDDIAALRGDGDLVAYLLSLTEGPVGRFAKPDEGAALEETDYVIPHGGAWPIGTAASGPTPTNGQCTCPRCDQKGTA